MREEISILGLEDRERWEAEYQGRGLPSQSWGYAWGLSASGCSPRLAVVRRQGATMLMPFVERSWQGTTDITTITGLSGASIDRPSSAPLALWHEYAYGRGWIAGYIQLAVGLDLPEPLPDSRLVAHNAVFLIDLHEGELLRTVSPNLRRKLRAIADTGVALIDDPPTVAAGLAQLYPEVVRRGGGANGLSAETFDRWARDPESLGFGALIDGRVEAVSLYRTAGHYAEGHIAATSERGRGLGAWMIWSALERLRENGIRCVNIGGGGRIGDGLYRFKERFNVAPRPLRSLRQIYNAQKYEELCMLAGAPRDTQWFPAYRATTHPEIETL